MVRSFWMGPPMLALALTSAWAGDPVVSSPYGGSGVPLSSVPQAPVTQSSSPYGAKAVGTPAVSPAGKPEPIATAPARAAEQAKPVERIITVQEMSGPGQQCRVVKEWHQADGSHVMEVKAIDTGEMMTIIDKAGDMATPAATVTTSPPSQPRMRMEARRIMHWGRNRTTPPAGVPVAPEPTYVASPAPVVKAPVAEPAPRVAATPTSRSGGNRPAAVSDSPVSPYGATQSAVVASAPAAPVNTASPYGGTEAAAPGQMTSVPVAEPLVATPYSADARSGPSASRSQAASRSGSGHPGPKLLSEDRPGVLGRMEAIRERKAEIASRTEAPEASDWRKSWGKVESTPVDKSVGSRPVSRVKDGDPLSAPRDYTKHAVSQAPRPGARSSVPPPPPLPVTPPGSGSVRAAGEPQYVPVPIVTVPPGRVPSVAPQMPAPQAPQPNAAFMTGAGPGGPPTMRNAFSDPGPSQPIPSETVPPDLVVNAFSDSAPDGTPVPAPAPPMVAGGYPMPPLPRMPVNAPMPPMQGMARMPMGMPMMRMPMGMPYVPAMSYPGVPHPAAMMRPGMPGPVNPMMQVPATSPVSTPTQAPSLSHLIEMLRKSDFPSQREWAAEQLAAQTGRNSAGAVSALADAARGDEAPLVRACCVRSLVRLQVNTPQVVALMQELHKDTDPRVRDAAAEALTAWGLKPADAGIQPAGGTQK